MAFNTPKPKGFVEEMSSLSVDDEIENSIFEKIDGQTSELSENVTELLSEPEKTDEYKIRVAELMKENAKNLQFQAEALQKYLSEVKSKRHVMKRA